MASILPVFTVTVNTVIVRPGEPAGGLAAPRRVRATIMA
jgi:hypothetical protein